MSEQTSHIVPIEHADRLGLIALLGMAQGGDVVVTVEGHPLVLVRQPTAKERSMEAVMATVEPVDAQPKTEQAPRRPRGLLRRRKKAANPAPTAREIADLPAVDQMRDDHGEVRIERPGLVGAALPVPDEGPAPTPQVNTEPTADEPAVTVAPEPVVERPYARTIRRAS